MKKIIILTTLILITTTSSYCQIRHVRGIKSFDVSGGISKHGYIGQLSFVNYFSNKLYSKFTGFHEIGEDSSIEYASSGLDAGGAYNLFKVKEVLYVNFSGGITLAIDRLTKNIDNINIDNTFKSGLFFGVENELFIVDKLVFITGFNQRFLINRDFGLYRYYLYGGLRYNF